jgi:hypothetical protein
VLKHAVSCVDAWYGSQEDVLRQWCNFILVDGRDPDDIDIDRLSTGGTSATPRHLRTIQMTQGAKRKGRALRDSMRFTGVRATVCMDRLRQD